MNVAPAAAPLEVWGGLECTVNRVGDTWFDQLAWAGHDRRADDLDRIASLGIRTLRYPLLWERLAPDPRRAIDWDASDERMRRLRALGIRPIVGLLHHGSGPSHTSLLDEDFPVKLAGFAALVAERYPWVEDFTPVNEPLTTARFSGLYGLWYPHGRSDRDCVRALLNQVRATVLSMRAIRDIVPHARLIQTEDCGRTFGRRAVASQVTFERDRQWLTWDLLTGRVDADHPLLPFLRGAGMTPDDVRFFRDADCPPDLIGLNYYLTSDRYLDDRVGRYPAQVCGGNGRLAYADVEAVRARAAGIAGHRAHLVRAWRRYGIPVALTEVHLGCTRDEQIRWLVEGWRGALAARRDGADVRAITAWALLGSYNWDSLVTRDDGCYEPGAFDVRGTAPRPTAIAAAISALAAGGSPRGPVLDGPPWWRCAERLMYAPARPVRTLPGRGEPILIIGGSGTLGSAFRRICEQRHLRSRHVTRIELDITDPIRTDAIVRRVRPWAVVNASGYVRVDAAESESDLCRRVNVNGAVNVAAACRRHGARLITFSSDLVFDGRARRPYVESDAPNPLNVYGRSKADAERRVLDLLPDALVIRTSAFFGPWDEYNFVAALFRAIDAGRAFSAPHDSLVSPTYVPDLAHACLDLLIDGERGVWHLANDAGVTWFEFARAAAARSGRGAGLIEPVETAAAWGPAVRPAFSALASERGSLLGPLDRALDAYLRHAAAAPAATGTKPCASR